MAGNTDDEVAKFDEYYEEIRQRFALSMKAEGIDEETRTAVLQTVDDNAYP